MASVEKVDFNLFRLFDSLYEERSVSRTAERLFITPSAVSHALRRMRIMMGDELFTRGPRGMLPTPRAHAIAAQLRVLLPRLSEVLAPPDFDPVTSERPFAVACVPYLTTTLMPYLTADFTREAPRARLELKLLHASVVDDLDSGTLDIALGHFRRTPPRFVAEEIFQDSYVWVMRRGHPCGGRPMTIDTLSQLTHVDINIDSQMKSGAESFEVRQGLERLVIQNGIVSLEEALLDAGLRRKIAMYAPDSLAGMGIVSRSDAVCLVPQNAAVIFADLFGLDIMEPPYTSAPLIIQTLTHADYRDKPAISWMLDRIGIVAAAFTRR